MHLSKRAFVLCVAVVIAVLVLARGDGGTARPQRLTVAMVPMGTIDVYWKAVHAGGLKAARELDLDLVWQGPMKHGDRSAQFDVLQSMVARGVSGIVLAPIDDHALCGPVEDAYRWKIPVVTIDSYLNSRRVVSSIATDNYKGGVLGGEHLAALLQGRGRVALMRGVEGCSSNDNRERGFLDAMKKYPGIQVVSCNQRSGPTTETAFKSAENLLTSLRSGESLNLEGIFCPNELTTFGMLRALQESGLTKKVKFVGFDSGADLNAALARGEIQALVVQDPVAMGYQGVYAIVATLNGKPPTARVDVPATVITTDNMTQPRNRQLLDPDLSILYR